MLTTITIGLSVYAYRLIDHRLHSAGQSLLYLLPYSISLFALLWRTASLTSPRDDI